MNICEETVHNKWTMKQEIKDNIDMDDFNDATYKEDYMHEIIDSLISPYNAEIIDFCSHFDGDGYWDLWLTNELGGDDPLAILRGNLYALYSVLASEVIEELQEEE